MKLAPQEPPAVWKQLWCGQSQPHPAHQWVDGHNFYRECAGHS